MPRNQIKDTEMMIELGEVFRQERLKQEMYIDTVATRARITRNTLYSIEQPRGSSIGLTTALDITAALGMSPQKIIDIYEKHRSAA